MFESNGKNEDYLMYNGRDERLTGELYVLPEMDISQDPPFETALPVIEKRNLSSATCLRINHKLRGK